MFAVVIWRGHGYILDTSPVYITGPSVEATANQASVNSYSNSNNSYCTIIPALVLWKPEHVNANQSISTSAQTNDILVVRQLH